MNVCLKLIILNIDVENGNASVLLHLNKIISKKLSPKDNIIENLKDLLVSFLQIRTDWVDFILVDLVQNDKNEIEIYYSCVIPQIIKNKKGKWYKIGEIQDENIQKIIYMASQKIY